ncbi:hypothetical protein [Pontibacter sp. SGAir0037]|uniref:hypothetical protein n=1 Tax=Pontibacter sp. SGAir0037 TaxID=2571030 RepID=UPI0010CD63DA|nr:hypothetical protein [Pontibacter sp. SGAir0037]QCR22848.1 hypothetical protein C1N53_11175 [Pontibacter sp. SGAir0037]
MTKSLIIKFLAGINAVVVDPGGNDGAVPEVLIQAIIGNWPQRIGDLCLYATSDERTEVSNSYVWVYKDVITGSLYELVMQIKDTKIIARRIPFSDKFLFEQLRYKSHISVFNGVNRNRKIKLYLTDKGPSEIF